jgi:hypothetical protein
MRREALAVGLLAAATFIAYAWSAHFWIDPVDEGYFLDLADRVSRGAIPYRDFTTYYTPGVFYLFAASFKLFGANLLWPRYMMAALRAATLLLTYGLTRRVAPWPIALLPFAATALLDTWPIEPEPHPSWPAIVMCLATMECVVRHVTTQRVRWLVFAGLTTGVCFLFKQNIGAFIALALGGYVVLRPRPRAGTLLKATQVAFSTVVAVAVSVLLWPMIGPLLGTALWIPVLAAIGLALWPAVCATTCQLADGFPEMLVESALVGGGFAAVSVAWLVPLAAALGPSHVPIGLFLGEVNEASIATQFDPFSGGIRAAALVAIWLPALLVRSRRALAAAALLSLLVPVLPLWQGPRDPLTADPQFGPPLDWVDASFGTLPLYLPALAAWAAVAVGFALRGRGLITWYLLFGALASLTIFPRSDTLHALVAGPPIYVAGAAALAHVYCSARRHKTALASALLVLPTVAIAPQVAWRFASVVAPEQDRPRLAYASLGMTRAPVQIPSHWAGDVRDVVQFVDAGTPPGQPFFAYPVEPLFNFLTDRPNPTQFDHFLPGTLTQADLQETVDQLQAAKPRYILWNHFNVVSWGTDPDNRLLSDYIWNCYEEVRAFNLYLVLERRPDTCA